MHVQVFPIFHNINPFLRLCNVVPRPPFLRRITGIFDSIDFEVIAYMWLIADAIEDNGDLFNPSNMYVP